MDATTTSYIGPVPAFWPLGHFDNPVLSSFVNWPADVTRLIFHELAHQLIYLPGDTVFNESYAVTVERAGLDRWLAHQHDPRFVEQAAHAERMRAEFLGIVQQAHSRLGGIYESAASPPQKRALKADAFATMAHDYEAAKARDPALALYCSGVLLFSALGLALATHAKFQEQWCAI